MTKQICVTFDLKFKLNLFVNKEVNLTSRIRTCGYIYLVHPVYTCNSTTYNQTSVRMTTVLKITKKSCSEFVSRSSTFNISCENDIDTLSIVAENRTLIIKDKLSRDLKMSASLIMFCESDKAVFGVSRTVVPGPASTACP